MADCNYIKDLKTLKLRFTAYRSQKGVVTNVLFDVQHILLS
jgi:hypothetical protein